MAVIVGEMLIKRTGTYFAAAGLVGDGMRLAPLSMSTWNFHLDFSLKPTASD
jgi:hypothetical protein